MSPKVTFSLLSLSLGINLFFVLNIFSKEKPESIPGNPSLIVKESKIEIIKALPIELGDIIFMGDSKTESFRVRELSNNQKIKNLGISGATIADMLEVVPLEKPASFFIEIGVNDIKTEKWSLNNFQGDFVRLVRLIKGKNPKTKIFIQSILPVSDRYFKKQTRAINTKIVETNKMLKVIAIQNDCTYVDIHSLFYNGTELNSDLTFDGLHLNVKGYDLWYSQVRHLISLPV
jgi:lysophospholipase L1-like esterase